VTDLPGADRHAVVQRVNPAAVRRPGPGITIKVQLADLLVPPARHDRLARAMPRGVIVVPPARGGLRIAPRPAGAIDREHQRPRPGRAAAPHPPPPPPAPPPPPKARVPPPMPAPNPRPKRQPRQRPPRPPPAEHDVGEPKQRTPPPPQAPIPPEQNPASRRH